MSGTDEKPQESTSEESFNNLKRETRDKINNDESNIQLSLVSYWFLGVLRIVLTLLPQIGYIHPDEYFQSLEVVSGDIYNTATTRPWEFNTSFPVRSVAVPYFAVGLPLLVLKNVAPFISFWFSFNTITPYFLLVVPRLFCCFLSFITDFCLYKICHMYGQNYRSRLLTLASSYVILVYGTHLFSNTYEMILSSVLIYLVAESMVKSDRVMYQDEYLRQCYNSSNNIRDRVKFHRLRLSLPWHTFSNVFFITAITVLGIFNRPTFVAFAFPAIFFWLQRGMGSRFIGLKDFNLRMLVLAICSVPILITLISIDSIYYGYVTWQELVQLKVSWSSFVVTPYNFLKYNFNVENLKEHGLHPRYTHFFLNIPMLYNILGVAGLLAFINIVYRMFSRKLSDLPRIQSIIGLMTSCFILPIAVLSFFPHQEPRFLIPCTLPLVFLHSQRIRHYKEIKNVITKEDSAGYKVYLKRDVKLTGKDGLLATWYFMNILCTLFFGFLHQGGIYPLMTHMSDEMASKPRLTTIHLVSTHIYPLPTSLLHLKYGTFQMQRTRVQKARDFFTYELGSSSSIESVAKMVKEVQTTCEKDWKEKRLKYRLYAVLPSSLNDEFQLETFKLNITVKLDKVFYPHVSTEALPTFDNFDKEDVFSAFFLLKQLSRVSHQFGLSIFSIRK